MKSCRKQHEMIALLKSAEVLLSVLDEPAQDEHGCYWKEEAEKVAHEVIEANRRLGEKGDAELWQRLIPALRPAPVQPATGNG